MRFRSIYFFGDFVDVIQFNNSGFIKGISVQNNVFFPCTEKLLISLIVETDCHLCISALEGNYCLVVVKLL
jgi:hypothetical protein